MSDKYWGRHSVWTTDGHGNQEARIYPLRVVVDTTGISVMTSSPPGEGELLELGKQYGEAVARSVMAEMGTEDADYQRVDFDEMNPDDFR